MPDLSRLSDLLKARGLVHDATPGLPARLATGAPLSAYVGFDPTADSLHVGNLVPVMALAWFQRLGGRPVVLVGGGTGMVGDPSGKRAERPVLPVETIDANARRIAAQLGRFVRFDPPPQTAAEALDGPADANAARLVDNATWLRQLPLLEFLRDTGKHFTVNYMLQKESVRNRMETGISFTEFTYMLVQAYDFWHLWRTERCELQMGGSDQWGNITAGIELIGRREGAEAHGLVAPLLTTAGGTKFGKSEGENVWLDPDKTSPYKFYQFWLNVDDRDVEGYLKVFTFLELDEIAAVMRAQAADPASRAAQRRLAEEATRLVHGEDETRKAVASSAAIFRRTPADGEVTAPDYAAIAETMPRCGLPRAELDLEPPLSEILIRAGLASSKADARRGIEGRGYSVNDETVTDVNRRLTAADVRQGRFVLLRKGKKNYAMLVID